MLVDGFISVVASLVAVKINENAKDYIFTTHMSEEPGMKIALDELGLKAPLHFNMRLGEGTGAIFFYNIIKNAMKIPAIMKTKEEVYKLYY